MGPSCSSVKRGRRRSSWCGKAQVRGPSRWRTAGRRMVRMMRASRKTALARPSPNSSIVRWPPRTKEAKTTTMTAAAGGDHAAGLDEAVADGGGVVVLARPFLVDAGDEEDLVVHREAEDDREHEHREERFDRAAGGAGEPAELEDGDDHAEGGADREQVHDRGLQGDQQGAEDDREQERGERDDDGDEQPELGGEDAGEVDEGRGRAADVDGRPRLPLERRYGAPAQVLDEGGRLAALRRGARVGADHGHVAARAES